MADLNDVKAAVTKKLAEKDAEIAQLKAQLAAYPAQFDALVTEINGLDPVGGNPGSEEPPNPPNP